MNVRGGEVVNALVGVARMPGTCGELVQGALEGVPFHVSCPIDIYAEAEVRLQAGSTLIFSSGFSKAGEAVRRALAVLGHSHYGGFLSISSPLPRSKGMASSTADLGAAVMAAARALEATIEPRQIAEIALAIEPTDGSIFPGLVLFDHRSGQICECLGSPPPIDIVVLDFGGEVDTLAFNQVDYSAERSRLAPQTGEALELVKAGIAEGDPLLIGRGATLSALANQAILYKPQLATVIALAESVGAVGVNVGHSGTIVGVLLDSRKSDAAEVHEYLRRRLSGLEHSFCCSLIGGGGGEGVKGEEGKRGKGWEKGEKG